VIKPARARASMLDLCRCVGAEQPNPGRVMFEKGTQNVDSTREGKVPVAAATTATRTTPCVSPIHHSAATL
jgi:hypothetical protein